MDGFGGYHTYMRDVPDRFETESDDRLMNSLYTNYATEGKTGGKPNGHFWVDKENAERVSAEVAKTHLGEGEGFVKTHFPALWKKYDVNEEGRVEIDRMPGFLRAFCGSNEACAGLQ